MNDDHLDGETLRLVFVLKHLLKEVAEMKRETERKFTNLEGTIDGMMYILSKSTTEEVIDEHGYITENIVVTQRRRVNYERR